MVPTSGSFNETSCRTAPHLAHIRRGFLGLDDSVRPGFTDVRLAVTLRGPESDERYAELRRAVDSHCPVLDLFANATPVTSALSTATILSALSA